MSAMLLATRCPHCKTTFKVANDQLKLQSGLVRCGVCKQVFNGIEHLAPTAGNTSKVNPAAVLLDQAPGQASAQPAMQAGIKPAVKPAANPLPQPTTAVMAKPATPVASAPPAALSSAPSSATTSATLPAPAATPKPLPPAGAAAASGAPAAVPATGESRSQTPQPGSQSKTELEFDLFDEFKIVPEPTTPGEARIEPRLDLNKQNDAQPEAQLADIFFPDMLSDEFQHTQSKADIEAKVQALLDADLRAHQDLAPAKSGAPVKSKAATIPPPDEIDGIEEIVVGKAQDHDQTLASEKPQDLRGLLGGYNDSDAEDEAPYDNDDTIDKLSFIRQANRKKHVTLVLSIATVLLAISLAGQGLYLFRDWIAASFPASRETLVTLCKLANCQVNLPASLDAISYEADELHTLPRDNTFEFSLLMRNHSTLPQAWPNIELSLKDSKKKLVLKRVFSPAEYLGSARDALNGFAANSEQPVKLYFVVDQVKASDYVVALFYP